MEEHSSLKELQENRQARREILGKKLYLARHWSGKSQAAAANYIGRKRHTIYRAERGQRDLSFHEMEELAAFYGMSLQELLSIGLLPIG